MISTLQGLFPVFEEVVPALLLDLGVGFELRGVVLDLLAVLLADVLHFVEDRLVLLLVLVVEIGEFLQVLQSMWAKWYTLSIDFL